MKQHIKSVILSGTKWSRRISILSLFAFIACADYVQDIEDQRDEWREEQARRSSEEQNVSSSSIETENPAIEYGAFTDNRDGQTYKTIKFGSQTWMAQNLNYETAVSYCYGGDTSNCTKYGRIYTWVTTKTVCPDGWHLPSKAEWENLLKIAGGASTAGKKLKSTSGWNSNGNGTDDFGFMVLPAGRRYDNGSYDYEGYIAYFWSSTKYDDDRAYIMLLNYDRDRASLNYGYMHNGFYVRCLQDNVSEQTTESTSSDTSNSSEESSLSSSNESCSSEDATYSSNIAETTSSSSVRSSSGISSSSSDTVTTSSSSVSQTSSSTKGSWAYLNPAISYGEMTDERDGQVYKTIVIGEQTWMAENLNYKYSFGTFCYQQQDSNCIKFGRLYTWAAAMDSVGSFSLKGKNCGYYTQCTPTYPVQGVCPNNWHLPTIDEWKELFEFESINYVAKFLKSATANWRGQWGSTNSSGFSAVPSGGLDYRNQNMGDDAFFWTSSISQEDTYSNSFYTFILSDQQSANYDNSSSRMSAFSIRCLKDHSNSNAVSSSSESAESSSSLNTTAEPCKTAEEDNCEYGTLEDTRDGHTYKTVKIDNQWWMAENLNYEVDSSFCYSNQENNCTKYGRLYRWAAVVGKSEDECGYGKACALPSGNIQGVCPNGWHLPSKKEWQTLFNAVGDSSTASKVLKSTSGWNSNGNGLDSFGFSALPAGYRKYDGDYTNEGNYADFWSSSEAGNYLAYYMDLYYNNDHANLTYYNRDYAFSVRCVKDD